LSKKITDYAIATVNAVVFYCKLKGGVNTMPRGRPTKDISRKDFEGLLSIGADQEEITAFFRFKLGSYSRATLHRWIKKEYGENENFETLKAQIGTPMLKMKVRQGLMGMVGKNAAATIFAAKNVLGYTDKMEQTQTINGAVPTVQVYIPDNGRDSHD
jgi:hypothetical protein